MAHVIEEEEIRLHDEDGVSTKLWRDRLEAENIRAFLKDKITSPPPGSNLDKEAFVMCIQTPFQLDAFRRLGNGFIGIDATHNITQYQNFLLFTIVARDRWGRGTRSFILPLSPRLFSQFRCSGGLDACVQWHQGYYILFCPLGPGRESGSHAGHDYDRPRPSADRRSQDCVSG